MKNRYKPFQFNKTAEFGKYENKTNAFGTNVKQYVKLFTLHCYVAKRTAEVKFQLIGTKYEDSITLVIRHNDKLEQSLGVKFKGQEYQIIDIVPDESANYNRYDFVSIKALPNKTPAKGGVSKQ